MGFRGAGLTRFREFVDREGDALAALLADVKATNDTGLSDWGPEPLKRVPKPFAPDHPQADLLRRKNLVVSANLPENWRKSGLLASLHGRMEGMLSLWQMLDGEFG